MSVSVEIIEDIEQIGSEAWDSVTRACPDATVFQSYAWCRGWLQSHRDLYQGTMIYVARRGSSVVGLAPMVRQAPAAANRQAASIGFLGAPHADYLLFPCVDNSMEVLRALLDAIRQSTPKNAPVELFEVPQFSLLGLQLADLCHQNGSGVFLHSHTECPRLTFSGSGRKARSATERPTYRRKLRQLESIGRVSFRHRIAGPEVIPELDVFFKQHIQRWEGTATPSLFRRESNRNFYRQLVADSGASPLAIFSGCYLDDRCISSHFGLLSRGSIIWYKPAFDLEFAKYSPGEMLLCQIIDHAQSANLRFLDFSRGAETFKFRFSTDVAYNKSFVLRRDLAGRSYGELRRLSRHIRRQMGSGDRRRLPRPAPREAGAQAPRALVLDGHSTAAVECVQSLGAYGITTDVASESTDALALQTRYASARIEQPSAADAEQFIAWIRAQVQLSRYAIVIPSTENSLSALNAIEDDDPLRNVAVLPSRSSVDIALNKNATWDLAVRLGIPAPRSVTLGRTDAPESLPFPTVLKPERSVNKLAGELRRLAPVIVNSPEQRAAALRDMGSTTVIQEQEYIAGAGVGVECLYFQGRMLLHFVHRRVHELPLTGGGSTYRVSYRPNPVVVQLAKRLLDALHWHGVAMVEFKETPDGRFFLMEINPRFWGSLALAIDCGVDFPVSLLRASQGLGCGPQPAYPVGYHTRHIARDVNWFKENLRANHRDPLLLTRGRLVSTLEYLRPLFFRESWDHFSWHDSRIIQMQLKEILQENLGGLVRKIQGRLELSSAKRRHRAAFAAATGRQVNSVMFVCYGNICRSAFAERYARTHRFPAQVSSTGFHPRSGRETPAHVRDAALSLGVDMREWQSHTIDQPQVDQADLIVVMDMENYKSLSERYPEARDRTILLAMVGPDEDPTIPDPYTVGATEAKQILERMARHIQLLARELGQAKRP